MNTKLFVSNCQTTGVVHFAAFFIFIFVLAFNSNGYGQDLSKAQNAEVSEWIGSSQHNQLIEASKTSPIPLPARETSRTASPNENIVNGNVDPSFADANIIDENARVDAIVIQPDGKILVGGVFTNYNGEPTSRMIRLNADGTRDTTFNAPSFSSAVFAIALQADGKVLVAGTLAVPSFPAPRIVRLNSDGSRDSTFNADSGSSSTITEIVIQPDGKILIGGSFSGIGGASRNRIARLNATGSLDTSFDPGTGANLTIQTIALQADGKILIGGDFTSFNGIARNRVARLNADGSLDANFNPGSGANNSVRSLAVLPDGKILVGGLFVNFNGSAQESIVRLNENGSLDGAFAAVDFDVSTVFDIHIQPDGKILVGGNFFRVFTTISRTNILRLNADGTLDSNFTTGFLNTSVNDIALQPNGKIVIGGSFSSPRNRIARLEVSGAFDASFSNGAGIQGFFTGTVFDTLTQPDGKTVIVGLFDSVNGIPRPGVARLNPDGTLDPSFAFGVNPLGTVRTIAAQPDGKILIGGGFALTNQGMTFTRIARLFPNNGNTDPLFNVGSGFSTGEVYSLAVQADGRILAAGNFAQYKGNQANNLVRILPDGNYDSSLETNVGTNGRINKVLLQPDNKILIGGAFISVNGTERNRIARLSSSGAIDETFFSLVAGEILSLAIQRDGKILVGTTLFTNGSLRGNVVRLNPDGILDENFDTNGANGSSVTDIAIQPNGKIIIAQGFPSLGSPVNGVARLNANGTIDTSFNTETNGSVFSVELLANGNITIGGVFNTVNGTAARTAVARLLNTAAPRPTLFDFDGDGKADVSVFRPTNGTWYLNRSISGFSATNFGLAEDKLTPADYDGDGKTEISVFRNGNWYRFNETTNELIAVHFGQSGDIPVPADYDGDGKADLAVFRNGNWYILQSSNNRFRAENFGLATDKPVPADYDGDGKTDVAVFRNGFWYILGSQTGFTAVQFGVSSDKPVVGDYDGDGKADQAVFRAGVWYLQQSSLGFTGIQFGAASDIPSPADYNGDGKTDLAVFRNGNWYLQKNTNDFTTVQFGTATDKPVPAAYVP